MCKLRSKWCTKLKEARAAIFSRRWRFLLVATNLDWVRRHRIPVQIWSWKKNLQHCLLAQLNSNNIKKLWQLYAAPGWRVRKLGAKRCNDFDLSFSLFPSPGLSRGTWAYVERTTVHVRSFPHSLLRHTTSAFNFPPSLLTFPSSHCTICLTFRRLGKSLPAKKMLFKLLNCTQRRCS